MSAEIRKMITDAISENRLWAGRELEIINGSRLFAYNAIKAYLDGHNKKINLFYDDVRVVLENDPITGLNSVYLERATQPSQDAERVLCTAIYSYFYGMKIDLSGATQLEDIINSLESDIVTRTNEGFFLTEHYETDVKFYITEFARRYVTEWRDTILDRYRASVNTLIRKGLAVWGDGDSVKLWPLNVFAGDCFSYPPKYSPTRRYSASDFLVLPEQYHRRFFFKKSRRKGFFEIDTNSERGILPLEFSSERHLRVFFNPKADVSFYIEINFINSGFTLRNFILYLPKKNKGYFNMSILMQEIYGPMLLLFSPGFPFQDKIKKIKLKI